MSFTGSCLLMGDSGLLKDGNVEQLRQTQTDFCLRLLGASEQMMALQYEKRTLWFRLNLPILIRAIELLEGTLVRFDIQQADADKVINAIEAYEEELLAKPDHTST
jgi:hemoglobin